LPSTLQELTLSYVFIQTINEGILPLSLKKLVLNSILDEPIRELPPTLEYLYLDHTELDCELPLTLTFLSISQNIYNDTLSNTCSSVQDSLLSLNLEILVINGFAKIKKNALLKLKKLKKIKFKNYHRKIKENIFP